MENRYKIMLIEDSRTQAEQIRQLFEREGWDVAAESSAESALDRLNQLRPDVIVVDYNLPGMNGDEFCRETRMNINHRGVPVLMLTEEGTLDSERRGLESGADDYLSKSVDPDILVLRVRALLRSSSAERILAPAEASAARARVLAVDDSPTWLHYLSEQLKAEHYDVEKAQGGREALARMRGEAFDCVIVDLEMPDIDGIELCRRIAAVRAETNQPVMLLALSAHERKDFAMRALEAGADDFIGKSADLSVLKARIRALLRRKFFIEENRRILEELKEKELAAVRARAEKEAAEVRAVMADQLAQSNRELEAANRRLNEALEVTKAITDNAAEALFMLDAGGRITFANPAAEQMFGFPPDELLGRILHDTLHDRRPDGSPYPIEDCLLCSRLISGEGATIGHEEVFYRKDGAAVDVACSLAPIVEDGNVAAGVMVVHDVTARKRSEERIRQSQKLESIGMLAGGVAHDFNNILTGIIGTASLIEEDETLPPSTVEQIRMILSGAERAADLTRQLLAYSGKGQFIIRQVDLSATIRQMSGLIRLSIPRNVDVQMHLDDGLPPVAADPGQMQQVILNLVVNAGEAVGEKGGQVSISTGSQTLEAGFVDAAGGEVAPGHYAWVEVRDTGSGMEEQVRLRIFEPFFSTKFTGRGLGLAAVSGILRSQKGGVVVTTQPGAGSTFRVLLPAARASQRQPAVREQGRPAVLVADDEECVRNFLRDALERHGYAVIPAGDGREALARFEEHRPEVCLVLVDLAMPVMGGRDLVAELKRRYPEARILLTSAHSESEARRLVADYPGTGFLQKPFSSQALIQKVRAALA